MNKIFTKVLNKPLGHIVDLEKNVNQFGQDHMVRGIQHSSHSFFIERKKFIQNSKLSPKLLLLSIMLAMGSNVWATVGDSHGGSQGQGHESHGNGYGHGPKPPHTSGYQGSIGPQGYTGRER